MTPAIVFPDDYAHARQLDRELTEDMVWRQPQWDEHDRPRVACGHLSGRRVGDEFCKQACPHLKATWANEFRELIGCAFPKIHRANHRREE